MSNITTPTNSDISYTIFSTILNRVFSAWFCHTLSFQQPGSIVDDLSSMLVSKRGIRDSPGEGWFWITHSSLCMYCYIIEPLSIHTVCDNVEKYICLYYSYLSYVFSSKYPITKYSYFYTYNFLAVQFVNILYLQLFRIFIWFCDQLLVQTAKILTCFIVDFRSWY